MNESRDKIAKQKSRINVPLMALALLGLLAGLWAGLVRLGWQWPALQPGLPIAHGPLMVSGFLGALISLERAVALSALGTRWTYAAPLLAGRGGLGLIAGVPDAPGPLLLTLGSLGLMAATVEIYRLHAALHNAVMALGALAWLVGNVLWLLGRPIPGVVLWWAGFLVLTIVGERLELNRVLRLTRPVRSAFILATAVFLAGLALSVVSLDSGMRVAGIGMAALAIWLLRFDIARRTVRKSGLTRFVAASLLAGYVWLLVAGLLGLAFAGVTAGLHYDAILRAIFLGFVLSMICGHAPIIFPAVLGVVMPYSPRFYSHLALLHLSLVLRVVSDLLFWFDGRKWGGLLNEVALLLFLVNTVVSVRQGRIRARQ